MIEISSSKQYTSSLVYITLKAKRIQPEVGLKKGPKHVVVKHIVQHSAINFVVF